MPAIQVYKHKGAIIPVEKARVSRGYICPWTEKLFKTKNSYVKHLKTLRRDRMHRSARFKRWHRLAEDLWSQPSFEKIVDWVELHPQWFLEAGRRRAFPGDEHLFDQLHADFSIKITYLKLTWKDCLSNSHSCPHNGVTSGWRDDDDRPRGYPGWGGRIEYRISHELPGFGSDVTAGTRINTGTGGGSGLNFGYDVKFFADDWPGLASQRILAILADTAADHVTIGSSRRR